jgi:uncharacterized protein (TIRG00374 family)
VSAAPPSAGPDPLPRIRDAAPEVKRAIWPRIVFLLITLVSLYILLPSLWAVFRSWPQLLTINPVWYGVLLVAEGASFACAWGLQRLALRTDQWFGVATAQLAGNAFSRIVPAGAAAGAAVQYRMLTESGIDGARVGAGLTAASLISTATLFALPLLSLPAALAGKPTPHGLAEAAWLGGIVFVIGFVVGWILFRRESVLQATGRAIQRVRNRLVRTKPPLTTLPDTLARERKALLVTLGDGWWKALLFALGNWLFDYLALLAAIAATGAHVRPTLVLLAYAASMVLGMIPITPGGLGFVEAGLTGLLALAGIPAGPAAVAVLAYRMVSFWLPLPAGAVAAGLHRRHYRGRAEALQAAP